MKKIVLIFIFLTSTIFANSSTFYSVVKNVSIVNTQQAINDALKLQQSLSKDDFKEFVKSWKKVEAIYLAGDIKSDYLDTVRYIDVYNTLKEDLNSQMARVVKSSSEVNKALFKNSFKTINALEYILFSDSMDKRKEDLAKAILESIIKNLNTIKNGYNDYLNSQEENSSLDDAKLINTLIASSYRLTEWRVGNPAGMSVKYKNDQKNRRAEYFLSQNSFVAIESILDSYKEILEEKPYKNLSNLAKLKNANQDINSVLEKIKQAKEVLASMKQDDFSNAKELFNLVSQIHDLYYVTIIEKLGLKANILDADGD